MSLTVLESSFPVWSEELQREPSSQDPLGLEVYSLRLAEKQILPGLNVFTKRARYYSFICWTLKYLEEKERVKTEDKFYSNFFNLEKLLVFCNLLLHPDEDIIGSRKTRPVVSKHLEQWTLPSKILTVQESTGCLNLYFNSLISFGLLERDDEKPLGWGLTDAGEKLARAYGRWFNPKDFRFFRWAISGGQKNQHTKELTRLGKKVCLSKLRKEEEDIIKHSLLSEPSRRQTAYHVLKYGKPLDNFKETKFLRNIYFIEDMGLGNLKVAQFCEYFDLAVQTLFDTILFTLENGNAPMTLPEVLQNLALSDSPFFATRLKDVLSGIIRPENELCELITKYGENKQLSLAIQSAVELILRLYKNELCKMLVYELKSSDLLEDYILFSIFGLVEELREAPVTKFLESIFTELIRKHKQVSDNKNKGYWVAFEGERLRLSEDAKIRDIGADQNLHSLRIQQLASLLKDLGIRKLTDLRDGL